MKVQILLSNLLSLFAQLNDYTGSVSYPLGILIIFSSIHYFLNFLIYFISYAARGRGLYTMSLLATNRILAVVTGVLLMINLIPAISDLEPTIEVLAAAEPEVTVSVPNTFIGDSFDVSVTFDNISAGDTGFGPYIDLYVPVNGTDGLNGDTGVGSPTEIDGIVSINSASIFGSGTPFTELTFPDDTQNAGVQNTGCVDHPFAVDNSGNPLSICGNTGDKLVVLKLPFGSVVPEQPAITAVFNVTMSDKADLNQPLEFRAGGGFIFGNDEFANPSSDPTITTSVLNSAFADPQIVESQSQIQGSQTDTEGENAIGPNYPLTYQVSATIANGQSADNFELIADLPDNAVFLGVVNSTPGCTPSTLPPTTGPQNGSQVIFDCGNTTGTVFVEYEVYLSQNDANSDPVIDPSTCGASQTTHASYAQGEWDPIDDRDKPPLDPLADNSFITPTNQVQFDNKCIQVQKSNSIAQNNGNGGYTPGDIIEYTLDFQVSDYFALGNIELVDVIEDGIHLDMGFATPSLEITSGVTTTAGDFDLSNITVVDNWTGAVPAPISPDGTTTITFDISGELGTRGENDILYGGCISPAPGPIDCENAIPSYNGGPLSGTVTYYGLILDYFTDRAGDLSVDHLDIINNTADIFGDVVDLSDRTTITANSISDDSDSIVNIQSGNFEKTIAAINGADPSGISSLKSGDTVTYRLRYDLPSSDTESFIYQDYLPKPIYDVDDINMFVSPDGGGGLEQATDAPFNFPPVNEIWLGPEDTFFALSGVIPTVSSNTSGNILTIDYGDFDDPTNQETVADIVFTVEVSDAPFANGLPLTNQAQATEANTNGTETTGTEINQITLDQPELRITKGAISSDNSNAVFEPAISYPAGFDFDAAGTSSVCPHFTGTLNSNFFDDGNPNTVDYTINSDISNIDGSDIVRFAVAIENIGSNGAYDVFVRDILPSGFDIPTAGLNLCATRGDGTVISTTNIGGGAGLFDQGIELVDPVDGVVTRMDPTNGENIVVLTYDLEADNNLVLQQEYSNKVSVFNYANQEGGTDFGGPGNGDIIFDEVIIDPINEVLIDKQVLSTEEPATNDTEAVIGSLITYRTELSIPEGETKLLEYEDVISAGAALVSIDSITADLDVTTDVAGGYSSVLTGASISSDGKDFTLDFGNITNTNNSSSAEKITIEYTVVVLNDNTVSDGDQVDNSATVSWEDLDESGDSIILDNLDDDNSVNIVEPELTITKNIVETGGDAGDTATVQISIDHAVASSAIAHDVVITDTLPAGMTFDSGFTTGGLTPDNVSESGGVVTIEYSTIDLAQDSTVSFDVTLDGTVEPAEVIDNTADLEYDSLSGDFSSARSMYDTTSIEKDYTADDSDSLTVDEVTVTKTIVDTTINDLDSVGVEITTGNDVVIGEQIQYQTVFTVPEGVSTDVNFWDTMDQGLSLVSVDSITLDGNITTDYPGGFAQSILDYQTTVLGNGNTRYRFDFDNVTNSDSDPGVETITMLYTAQVDNIPEMLATATVNNRAQWRYSSPLITVEDNSPNVTVLEPELVTTKSVNTTNASAGNIVTYTVTVENTGTAPALDVVIDDDVPDVFNYVPATGSVTSTYTNNLDDTNAPDLMVTVDQIDVGETVTFTYDLEVLGTAIAGETYTNEVDTTWTSLTGADATERTGLGGVNDYLSEASSDLLIDSIIPNKEIVATSYSATGPGADTIERVAIGEIVRYRLVSTMSQSTAPDFAMVDMIPDGLTYLNDGTTTVALISNDGGVVNMSSSSIPAGAEVLGNTPVTPTFVLPIGNIINETNPGNPFVDGDDVRFDLGTITNGDTDSDFEYTVIEFNALVTNQLNNQSGVTLSNQFEAVLNPGGGETTLGSSLVDTFNSVTVAEADINITKTITTTPVDAGDDVVYEIRVTNGSGDNVSSSHNLQVTDLLTSTLTLQSVSVTGPTFSDNSNIGGNFVDVVFDVLAPSEVAIITVTATVNSDVDSGLTVGNQGDYLFESLPQTATLNSNPTGSAVPGLAGSVDGMRNGSDGVGVGLNNYAGSNDVSFTLGNPIITKYAPTQTEYAIGDIVTYEILVTPIEGETEEFVVTDLMPNGLDYVSFNYLTNAIDSVYLNNDFNGALGANTASGGFGSGNDVVFDFGQIVVADDNDASNNSFVIEISARVVNEAGNQNGTELVNGARVSWQNPNDLSNPFVDVTSDPIKIIEPELEISKTISDNTLGFEDQATYTIEVTHSGTSTADAYDVVVSDVLSSQFNFVVNSETLPAGWVFDDSSLPTITFTGDLPLGDTATITFDIETLSSGSYTPGTVISNAADVNWTSISGVSAAERNGSGGVNDYTQSGNVDFTIEAPDLYITVSDGINTLNPGDNPVYDVEVINLGNVQSDNVIISIDIPNDTTFDTLLSDGGWSCSPDNNAGSTCTINVGTINPSQIVNVDFGLLVDTLIPSGPDDIEVIASAADDGVNGIESDLTNNTDNDVDTLDAAPDIAITKDDGVLELTPGAQTTYVIDIENVGTQDADDVEVIDTLPSNVSFVSATNGGTEVLNEVVWPLFDLAAGNSVQYSVTVEVDTPLGSAVETITNSVTANDDGLNGTDLNPANNTDSDTNTITAAPDLTLAIGLVSPVTVVPGNELQYEVTYGNIGDQDATGSLVTISVPAGTVFDSANLLNAGWSCTPNDNAGSVCSYTIGDIDVADSGTLDFVVDVLPTTENGLETIDISATIADDGLNGVENDYSNNADSASDPLVAVPDLRVTKTNNTIELDAGEFTTYIIEVFNDGNQDMVDTQITDTLPAHVSFVSASGLGSETGGVVSWPLFDLAVGQARVFTVTVQVDFPLAAGVDDITNTVNGTFAANSGDVDPTPGNNSDTDNDTVIAAPDLSVTKTDNGSDLIAGQPFSYDINYSNNGSQDATGVELTETIPAYTSFDDPGSSVGWTCAPDNFPGSTCTLVIGDLDSGDSGSSVFSVIVDSPQATQIDETNNTVTITDDGSNGVDENPVDNTATEVSTIVAQPDMYTTITAVESIIDAGDTLEYVIDYGNTGNQTADGVVVTVTIPDGAFFDELNPLNSGWSCTSFSGGGVCTLNVGTVLSGESGTLDFVVVADNPVASGIDNLDNTVSITDDGSNGTDPNLTNNIDSESVVLNAAPDIAVLKDNGVTEIAGGDMIIYTITVSNFGTQDATGVLVSDILPADLTYVSSSDSGSLGLGNVVTWPAFDLAVGDSVTRTVEALLDYDVDEIPAGLEMITNQVTAFDDGTNGGDLDGSNNIDDDMDDVLGDVDLTVTIDDGQTMVETNEDVLYTVIIGNDGTQYASNTIATITIPDGVSFNAGLSTPGWVCTPDNQAGSSCTINVGTVDTDNLVQVEFVVTVDPVMNIDQITTQVDVSDDGTSGADLDVSNNTDSDTDSVTGNPDLTVTKTNNQNIAISDQTITYEIEVINNGDIILTGIEVVDTLPLYTSFVSSDNGGVYDSNTEEITWSGITLLSSESIMLELVVQVDETIPSMVEELINSVVAYDDGTHGVEVDDTDNMDNDIDTLEVEPDLSVVIATAQPLVYPGEEVEFIITHVNEGDQDATGVEVTFTIPEYTTGQPTFEVVSGTNLAPFGFNIGWNCPDLNPGTTCTYGLNEVAAGEECDIPFFVVVDENIDPSVASLSANASVYDDGANGAEITYANNDTLIDVMIPFVDVQIDMSVISDEVNFGESVFYELVIENNGPDGATEVVITNVLPEELTFINAMLEGVDITPIIMTNSDGTSNLVFQIGDLGSGESVTLLIEAEVISNVDVSILNTASVASREAETTYVNNDSNQPITIFFVPDTLSIDELLRTGGVFVVTYQVQIIMLLLGGMVIVLTLIRTQKGE